MTTTFKKVSKIKFPKSFKLFGQKVDVIHHHEIFFEGTRALDGQCDINNSIVQINLSNSLNYNLNTLTHEVVHYILDSIGLKEESYNEHLVNALALGFNNWLLDNPEIIKLFQKVAKENNNVSTM